MVEMFLKVTIPVSIFIVLFSSVGIAFATPPSRQETLVSINSTSLSSSFSLQDTLMIPFCNYNRFDVLDSMKEATLKITIKLENVSDEISLLNRPISDFYSPFKISKSYPDGEIVTDVYSGRYFNPFEKEFVCGEVYRASVTDGMTLETRTLDLQDCILSGYSFPCEELSSSVNSLGYNLSQLHNSKIMIYLDNDIVILNQIEYMPGTGYRSDYSSAYGTNYMLVVITIVVIATILVLYTIGRRKM